MNKILNLIGTGLILFAIYLRMSSGQAEPSYLYGLWGSGFIAAGQMLRIHRG